MPTEGRELANSRVSLLPLVLVVVLLVREVLNGVIFMSIICLVYMAIQSPSEVGGMGPYTVFSPHQNKSNEADEEHGRDHNCLLLVYTSVHLGKALGKTGCGITGLCHPWTGCSSQSSPSRLPGWQIAA